MTVYKKSLLNWVGGKRLLRKTIAPLIPTDITSYIEPFGGAGWVLFWIYIVEAPLIETFNFTEKINENNVKPD